MYKAMMMMMMMMMMKVCVGYFMIMTLEHLTFTYA